MLESYRRAKRRGATDLRRDHRLRLLVRRIRNHPAGARGQGGGALDVGGPARGPHRPFRNRLHQRPRHEHPAQRPDGDGRRQARLRPPGQLDSDELAEVDDRPLDRRLGGRRSRRDRPVAAARASCRRPSTWRRPIPIATSTTFPTRRARCRWKRRSPTASASAARMPRW